MRWKPHHNLRDVILSSPHWTAITYGIVGAIQCFEGNTYGIAAAIYGGAVLHGCGGSRIPAWYPFKCSNLSYYYDDEREPALQGLTLTIPEGEWTAVIGPGVSGNPR